MSTVFPGLGNRQILPTGGNTGSYLSLPPWQEFLYLSVFPASAMESRVLWNGIGFKYRLCFREGYLKKKVVGGDISGGQLLVAEKA